MVSFLVFHHEWSNGHGPYAQVLEELEALAASVLQSSKPSLPPLETVCPKEKGPKSGLTAQSSQRVPGVLEQVMDRHQLDRWTCSANGISAVTYSWSLVLFDLLNSWNLKLKWILPLSTRGTLLYSRIVLVLTAGLGWWGDLPVPCNPKEVLP